MSVLQVRQLCHGFREVKWIAPSHREGNSELGCKARLSDCCCATSSIAAARLTHVHETDIYFRAILRSNWRCCGGNLTQREGKGVSRRNTEQQIIMHYQSMKPWIDYLIVIFDFGYLNVFSFSIFVRLCGEDTFCSFPKGVLWTLSVCTRVTVRTRFCRTPLVSHPCLDPHPIVSTAKNLVLLLCQFFSARKIFCHVFFFFVVVVLFQGGS